MSNKRAGPHKAWFEDSMNPTWNETIVVKLGERDYWRQDLKRGTGDEVLELLGFSYGLDLGWIRRTTERPG